MPTSRTLKASSHDSGSLSSVVSAQRTAELTTSATRAAGPSHAGSGMPGKPTACSISMSAGDAGLRQGNGALAFDVVHANGLRQTARRRAAAPMTVGTVACRRRRGRRRGWQRSLLGPSAPSQDVRTAGPPGYIPRGPATLARLRPFSRAELLSPCCKGFFRDPLSSEQLPRLMPSDVGAASCPIAGRLRYRASAPRPWPPAPSCS